MIKKHISLQISVPIIALVAIIILSILWVVVNNYSKNSANYNSDRIEKQLASFETNLNRIQDKALLTASFFSNLEITQDAYQILADSNDRELAVKPLSELLSTINKQVKTNINKELKVHFHTPDIHSLYRCWSDKRGDDISGFRNTIKEAVSSKRAVKGIEVGRGGLVIRGVVPITNKAGDVIGTVENFYPIDEVLNKLKSDSKDDQFAVFLNNSQLGIAVAGTSVNVSTESMKLGNFVLVNRSSELFNIDLLNSSDLDKGMNTKNIFSHRNFTYAIIPLKDFSGKSIGVYVYQLNTQKSDDLLANMKITVLIIAILMLLLLSAIIVVLTRRIISKPLNTTEQFLKQLENGILKDSININRKDEIGKLQIHTKNMLIKIKDVIQTILESSTQIIDATENVHESANSISSSSDQQSSTVEELSASIEEMTATIEKNTEIAQENKIQALESAKKFEAGSESVEKTIGLMKTVADKIMIISDIANKTNMLALNAAVEAARAGNKGKGFAVVATEVKNLAERSAKAADEIQELSKESFKIAETSQELFIQILPSIKKTAKQMEEVAIASIQQNANAQQINSAAAQFSSTITHNTNAVDLLVKNAELLKKQSDEMNESVSYFSF